MKTPEPTGNNYDAWTLKAHPLKVSHAVLVVDDDRQIRSAIKRTLRNEPYKLVVADSGMQALDILSGETVQVVVSDLGMPGMDGMSLLAAVADRSPDVIRMVLSGHSDSRLILDAINSGSVYRYILKPWDNDHLKIVIRQALALWDLQAEREALLDALQTHNQHLEKMVAQRTLQMLAVERQADIGRYASQIVHNLSNPLHALSAALQLLDVYVSGDRPVKEKMEKGLHIARSAADDLREIIGSILSHAREEAQFTLAPMDVNPVIEKEITFFEMSPDFKYKIEKELLLDTAIPRIRGNPIQIKQILDNLIKNALDAMADAPVKRLTVQTVAEEDHVVIRVSDTGQGISPEHMDRIFSSNFTTKPVGQGTGLGLASVKTMVEAYSGTIQVASTVDRGTTFDVRLPVIKADPKKTIHLERAEP
ncbi:hybrid sensor histidine kinase/response regulator [uncultured Desulfosarcina sp.]|uniref:hybrid sensor histidine kinase/response regulator n=1 Tax=uncultured Desulfosarcina sp. TaxID=218289 RepID=UPI0029C788C8|nr:hybrid sensor histidine kinase/response regulator [uncultured Desulfosarcina sp.]